MEEYNHNNINLAKNLRKNITKQEYKLWNIIRAGRFYGYKFKRQTPIGNYIVDFVCKETKIIIEIDGGQHNEGVNIQADTERTEYLNSKGYKVYRFWNNEIDKNIDGVYLKLKEIFEINK